MTATTVVELPRRGGDSYLTDGMTISSWLLTHDHKRIAILYCLSITAFFSSVVRRRPPSGSIS